MRLAKLSSQNWRDDRIHALLAKLKAMESPDRSAGAKG
jgi:hypothetical protein